MQNSIRIHENDNVAVALKLLPKNTKVLFGANKGDIEEVTLLQDIPAGHKFAVEEIEANSKVVKYGYPIGIAKETIHIGELVHTHNLRTGLGEILSYKYNPVKQIEFEQKEDSFLGYFREDGRVGVRNEIWIIPTVGCVNSIAKALEKQAQEYLNEDVDAIVAFNHPYGCSQMGEDQEDTRRILADLIRHPNAGGVLVLGLGCENSNIGVLKEYIGKTDDQRVKYLVCQESEDEIKDGLKKICELVRYASSKKREKAGIDKLVVGLKCGGSDGFSGITANPTVGKFSDLVIQRGGTTILTEVPEMFGAETILMNRCKNQEVFDKTVCLINQFKDYFVQNNQTIYENPSPGNKAGGISTLEDKSLGCTQKSGSTVVRDVLQYGEEAREKGLNLLNAPGNDLVAATALAASGAQIVLFTTGRGTPFASPVPTVKIASNTVLATKKKNWIDFNAGIVAEETDIKDAGKMLYDFVIQVANGKRVCSEEAGFHDMAIFKKGVTL